MSASTWHRFYDGIGQGVKALNSLPEQTIPDKQKTTEFRKKSMDALESIGLKQLAENKYLKDFYDMIEGRLAKSDYIDESQILTEIANLADDVAIPSFVKHYDFIGIILRRIIGEWLENKDNFRVDSIDEISDNEYIRERTRQMSEFTLKLFNKELEIGLLKAGIDSNKTDFQSEEEKQAYIQMLEEEKAKLIPPEVIDEQLSKTFKTQIAEWAQHTLNYDHQRYFEDELLESEMRDKLATGKFFRHYHIGYDYYKPERWSPLETFFSQDVNARYPQDGEFVGRITFESPSDIQKRFGHLMSGDQIKDLNKMYRVGSNTDSKKPNRMEQLFGKDVHVPFHNYFEYDLALQTQDAFGIPMGELYQESEEGSTKTPTWLSNLYHNNNFAGVRYASTQREDINVRTDLVQCTEAYWRSWKRMWFLNYTTEQGYHATEIITDDILPEFIKEHKIKKVSSKSLNDLNKNGTESNTMYEFWIPEVWRGIKINSGNSLLGNDLYLDIKPLEYQIKGDSHAFDVKLPVVGYIGESLAKRLRPFQIGYNICLNQIFNLLEKELGMFFLFDINLLPSEYKNQGTTEEVLFKMRNLAKDIGMVPIDVSKPNLHGGQAMNTFIPQDISFDKQIQSRTALADYYFRKGLEQVGISPESLGQGSAYDTATKTKLGAQSTIYSTSEIFNQMSIARRKSLEVHLAIAQYCQKEYIDQTFIFRSSDGDKIPFYLNDPDFQLRKLGLFVIDDPKQRRRVEEFKNTLLQTNALGSDILMFSDLFFSDSMSQVKEIAKRAQKRTDEATQSQRTHEQEMLDKQIQAEDIKLQQEREFKATENEKDRQNRIKVEEIDSLGRAADKQSDDDGYRRITEAAQQAVINGYKERDLEIKKSLTDSRINKETSDINIKLQEIELLRERLELEKQKDNTKRYVAERKNFDSAINKN